MLKKLAKRFWVNEQGLELSEYAIMIALLLVIAVVTISQVGGRINVLFQQLLSKLGG